MVRCEAMRYDAIVAKHFIRSGRIFDTILGHFGCLKGFP